MLIGTTKLNHCYTKLFATLSLAGFLTVVKQAFSEQLTDCDSRHSCCGLMSHLAFSNQYRGGFSVFLPAFIFA
ncbi:hypothetical protein [Microcoleus sp. herbarium12]|uniref:hypothetical protein n=1 Tax=Microcoleus sp. herbarium12 TaxID=3055437 RepID=UPI003FA55809